MTDLTLRERCAICSADRLLGLEHDGHDCAMFQPQVPSTPPAVVTPGATASGKPQEHYSARQNHVLAEIRREQSFETRGQRRPVTAQTEDPAEVARIKAKANRLYMEDAIRDRGMLWDNRIISFAEWDAKVRG